MKLIETIETFISGDWGNESHTEDTPCEVFCVRGADIEPIKNQDYNHIPKRYISKRSYENKLLQVGDIIVEKSGGSPTQSTGRVCLITPNLIEKLQSVDCSNFCAAFRVKKEWDAEYIYLYIQHFYNMGAFFNFEGKTSGIKNLQLEQAYQAIEIKPISIAEQKKLAKTIRTIDGKTAINRSINQNFLRTDEAWMVEKKDGGSHMYSLNDFKIHNTINIENGYMEGRYGAIPFIGELNM